MAMSCTITEKRNTSVKKIKLVVVSASDGTASGTTPSTYDGEVLRFVAAPGAAGAQPTDQFDIALNDADGYDILAGQGANLSNAAPSTKVGSMGAIAGQKITLAASNMGDSKGVTLYLYIR
jgi:hypothetical protein